MRLSIVALSSLRALWIAGADETVTVYHMFEPKYTGLDSKDAGDFGGEMQFMFMTFNPFEASNPEAAIGHNVFEMSTVTVQAFNDTGYTECNAPGCTGQKSLTCPANNTDYCCVLMKTRWPLPPTLLPYEPDENTLPGREQKSAQHHAPGALSVDGYWYSFPKESKGKTWTETLNRRISSSCVAQAWRDAAGGCPDCGDLGTQCVGKCIQAALVNTTSTPSDVSKLKVVWDQAFSNKTMCPDVPLPSSTLMV